jgi:hypothetical protein
VETLPAIFQKVDMPETQLNTTATVRRNHSGGLVEEALENYTHIDHSTTAMKLQGPHASRDDAINIQGS